MQTDPTAGIKGRLLKARTQLVLDEPFFGALALRLPFIEDRSCESMWVDGVNIGYNPKFVADCSIEELKGTICHELLHVANGHCWRRGNRDLEDWNDAGDYVINPIVVGAGFTLPGDVLMDPQYRGRPTEQVYAAIHRPKPNKPDAPQVSLDDSGTAEDSRSSSQEDENEPDDSEDQNPSSASSQDDNDENDDIPSNEGQSGANSGDAGDGEPEQPGSGGGNDSDSDANADDSDDSPNSASNGGVDAEDAKDTPKRPPRAGEVRDAPRDVNPDQLETEWKIAIDQAAKAASMRGNLPGDLKRIVEQAMKPRVDWRDVLRQFIQQAWNATDYTWRLPSTRFLALELYLPRMASEAIPSIIVFIDTSMSIWGELLAAFQAEVTAIVDETKPEETYIGYADAQVAGVDRFETGEAIVFNHRGGGGTDFRPAFEWVEQQQLNPACFVYLTDLEGYFPAQPPDYPVLWVSPPTHIQVPWGTHVEMRM